MALEDTLSDTWINLAFSVDGQGKYEEALGIMQNALERFPLDSAQIMYYTSMIHSRNEQFELAREGYSRLLVSYPDNIQYRFNLAASLERLGEFDQAVAEFKKVLDTDPENALALNYLGYMYADRGINLKEARKMIKKALEIDPDNSAYLDSYAWVLYKLGEYEEAIISMDKAVEQEQEDPILFDHRGDIYAAMNQIDKAVENWEKALQLDPDNHEIKAKLNKR